MVTELREFLTWLENDTGRRPAKLRMSPQGFGALAGECRERAGVLIWDSREGNKFEGIPVEVDSTVPDDPGFLAEM